MDLRQSARNRLKLGLIVFLVFTAGAGHNATPQSPQCSVSAQVVEGSSAFLCSGTQWPVQGTETAGPHPGKFFDFGATKNLAGVCAYSYTACNGSGINIPETDPSVGPPAVQVSNSGVITVTVAPVTQSASANPVACNCKDPVPDGYNSVTMNAPTFLPSENFNGQC
jgi:hypothetical protein